MERMYLPYIAPENYDSIRRIVNADLPDTHYEWLKLHAERLAKYGQTNIIKIVEVNPDEFAEFVDAGNRGGNNQTLLRFAAAVGARNEN